MAMVRAAVYFLHEHEEEMASQAVKGPERVQAGGFILGDVDERDLARLEAEGLAVERIDTADDDLWDVYMAGAGGAGGTEVVGGGGTGDELEPPSLPEPGPGEEVSWALQVNGPLVDEWRTRLADGGLPVFERLSRFGYLARGTTAAADAAMNQPFVQRLERAVPPVSAGRETESAGAGAEAEAGGGGGAGGLPRPDDELFDLVLDGSVAVEAVVAELEARGTDVVDRGMRRVRVRAQPGDPLLLDPRPLPGVLGVSAYVEPELLNDHARALVGVPAGGGVAGQPALDGTGQIVAVTDTGIDQTHPDFEGRLLHVVAKGRPGDASDPDGHGTHVAGSIVGTGAASAGAIRGIAPGAQMVFQSVLDSQGGLGGLRAGVHELLAEAYEQGARVHNHSWGALAASEYRADSLEVDGFVWEHPDALVVVAAGNDGRSADPLNAPSGFVDLFSLRAPATAKNVLTVGAACSDRTDGPTAGHSWTSWSGVRFPPGGVGDRPVSGDPEMLAGFSSRGPCQDRRIKPDVVAPGTEILSTRSVDAPAGHFGGPHANPRYAYMAGTSMAAPIAAGVALLVRQWYVEHGHQPSAALLKATLINGCRWLTGDDAVSSNPVAPNFDQGFGELHLPTTLPPGPGDPADPNVAPLVLRFVDTLATPAAQFVRDTDRAVQVRVDVGDRLPLRICMCFTDPPGRYTQNDLTLIVEGPDGRKVFGNDDRPKQFRGADADNTVEIVRIAAPAAGEHRINVVARNILHGPQGFALVVTGDLGERFDVGRH